MIWVIGGTKEARIAAEKLVEAGYEVLVTTASRLGKDMFEHKQTYLEVISGKLDAPAMLELLRHKNIEVVVDASHPFAEETTKNAFSACEKEGVRYLRFERPKSSLPKNELIHWVFSYEEAAELAANFGPTIFLTIGLKKLEVFVEAAGKLNAKIIARILPLPHSLTRCLEVGLAPNAVVAVKGVFSKEFNQACFREYGATVVVTKESGTYGGLEAKVEAALALAIPIVIIERPPKPAGITSVGELIGEIKKR